MSVLVFMVPMSILLGFGFVAAYWWSASHGQFDDLQTPSQRILENDIQTNKTITEQQQKG